MKKILFISHGSYHTEIITTLEELGFEVTYYNDKPNDGFVCKALGRYKVKMSDSYFHKYYMDILEREKERVYDYVFMINAEYVPEKSLGIFKEQFVNSKFILYLWDSIKNKKGTKNKLKYFDYSYSFDTKDVDNTEQLILMPLFYIRAFEDRGKDRYDYDLSFIGTAHGDRPKIIKYVKKAMQDEGKNMYSYLYSPHLFVYWFNKFFNKDYKGIKLKDIKFAKLPYAETANIYRRSKCVIDVENKGQSGLTIRTIEMLGMKKKLITTNQEIKKYDFYNPNNILVVDRDNFTIDFSFIEKEYEELPDDVYKSYSLYERLQQIFAMSR